MAESRRLTTLELTDVFESLRAIMLPYGQSLLVQSDEPGKLYIDTHHMMKNGKPLFFGAVQTTKNYVSYHLMPVYVNPGLLDSLSPAMRRRMQGKSCFNFKVIDEALFEELADLTKKGFDDYRVRGFL